jgi:uncharacterized protein (DUF2236 family)
VRVTEAPLSSAEIARLRRARPGARVDPGRSLFEPDSFTWRVNREAALVLAGGRALLMQVAHPLVAAGVAAYSDFRRDPLERLRRTLDLTLTIVFADAARAVRAVGAIERAHARVRGMLADDAGRFPRGTAFDARHPALLLWVHATLVDSALVAYERFVEPLSTAERAAYYDESRVTARLLGIPDVLVPPTQADFDAYLRGMLAGGDLAVGATARAIADAVLRPRVALVLRPLFGAAPFITAGLLPAPLRAAYDLRWDDDRARAFAAWASAARRLVPALPDTVRLMPQARRAGVDVPAAETGPTLHFGAEMS